MVSDAVTEPVASTRTPLVLPVPMSIPSSKSTRQPYVQPVAGITRSAAAARGTGRPESSRLGGAHTR